MLTTYKELEDQLLLLAEEILEQRYAASGLQVASPEDAQSIIINNVGCGDYADYSIVALMLSPLRRILEIIVIEASCADPVRRMPAKVAREAIRHGASSVVIGVQVSLMEPDESHRALCRRIATALEMVGIHLSDFILADDEAAYSFSAHRERALPRSSDEDSEPQAA